MIYRVLLKVSYNEAYFDFKLAEEACLFAKIALEHSATSEDQNKLKRISIQIINPDAEEED